MAEEDKSSSKISRRQFLAGGFSSFIAAKIDPLGTAKRLSGDLPKISSEFLFGNENEEERLRNEIVEYRRKLGLFGYSWQLQQRLYPDPGSKDEKEFKATETEWYGDSQSFDNSLPERIKSYGLAAERTAQILFGSKASKLVKRIEANPSYSSGITISNGVISISSGLEERNSIDNWIDTCFHEVGGHGSDPEGPAYRLYPRGTLLRVEHGKWRALSQSFSVKGQFFNHPGDGTLPVLKQELGEIAGRHVVKGEKVEPPMPRRIGASRTGQKIVDDFVEERSGEKGVSPRDLKFNKKVCRDLGAVLVEFKIKEGIGLYSKLGEKYNDMMEWACSEIWAEMVRISIFHPELIGDNDNIREGVEEVLLAILERPVNLGAIKEQILPLRDEVLERRTKEEFLGLTDEENQTIKRERERLVRDKKYLQNFINNGRLPDTLEIIEAQRGDVSNFSRLYREITVKYASLIDTEGNFFIDRFDPDLNLWEIKEIEWALDMGFVKDLLSGEKVSDENLETIKNKNSVLQKFIESDAF